MGRAFTESEKNRIRDTLLEKSRALFVRQGLKKTSIDQIVRAAGIGKGSFYVFFAGKEDLYLALLMEEEKRRDEDLDAFLGGDLSLASFEAFMAAQFPRDRERSLLGQFFARREWGLLYRILGEDRMRANVATDTRFAEKMLHRLRERGLTPLVSAEEILNLFYALFFAFVHHEELPSFSARRHLDYLSRKIGEDLGLR